jgi:hypothetical protein
MKALNVAFSLLLAVLVVGSLFGFIMWAVERPTIAGPILVTLLLAVVTLGIHEIFFPRR